MQEYLESSSLGSDGSLQLLLQGCPMLPPLPWMATNTTLTIHNPPRLHLEGCFANPTDYTEHAYIVFDLENDKPTPKSIRDSTNEHQVVVKRE